jgi:predicted nucleic acid-binding protein
MMARVVVDTDVVSFYFKGDTRAALYDAHLEGNESVISFMTLAELEHWAVNRRWGTKRHARLIEFLKRFHLELVDRALCRKWAEVVVAARRRGRPIDTADAWIAATALQLGVPLVTHNVGDYAGVSGVAILSEAAP